MTAMLKHLRIAVTALSLAACVLLVALWVRSYWRTDAINLGGRLGVISESGTLEIVEVVVLAKVSKLEFQGSDLVQLLGSEHPLVKSPQQYGFRGLDFTSRPVLTPVRPTVWRTIIAPYWLVIFVFASTAALPWLTWRFSLRTLLIATTLVAVALGIVVMSR
jgi:hypothetical protein